MSNSFGGGLATQKLTFRDKTPTTHFPMVIKGLFNKSTEYPLVFDLDMKYNYSTENVTAEYPETIEKYINMGDDENGARQN